MRWQATMRTTIHLRSLQHTIAVVQVLQNLAESEENAERLQEAIRAYETALTVCMEQQQPFHLAVLCRVNKSTARLVLAELTQDSVLADEVADDFEVIIECFPHALQPLCLKHCEQQMEKAREMTKAFCCLRPVSSFSQRERGKYQQE